MVHTAGSEAEMRKSGCSQEVSEDFILLVKPTRCDTNYITVAQQVTIKLMCETPVLASTQAVGLIEVIPH